MNTRLILKLAGLAGGASCRRSIFKLASITYTTSVAASCRRASASGPPAIRTRLLRGATTTRTPSTSPAAPSPTLPLLLCGNASTGARSPSQTFRLLSVFTRPSAGILFCRNAASLAPVASRFDSHPGVLATLFLGLRRASMPRKFFHDCKQAQPVERVARFRSKGGG